jgi:transcriptional regulator with XRE-family HTH domain
MEATEVHIGRRIRQIRKNMNLTQTNFSSILHTSIGFISEVERGKKQPGFDLIFSLKRNFNISTDWLLTGKGTMFGAQKTGNTEGASVKHDAQIRQLEAEKQLLLEQNLQLKAQVEVLKELIVKLKTS